MKRLIPIFALFCFLVLFAWCRFHHIEHHQVVFGSTVVSVDTPVTTTATDWTQVISVAGSVLSALVALITNYEALVSLFKRKPTS